MADLAPSTNQQLGALSTMLTKHLPKLSVALAGSGVTPERFRIAALSVVRKNPKLLQCDQTSLWYALYDAAMLGIELGESQDTAYVIPYGSEAKLMLSYKGQLDLARRRGMVKWESRQVKEGDEFGESDDLESDVPIRWKITTNPLRYKQPTVAVICIFHWSNHKIYHWMTTEEIDQHKERYSPSWQKKDSPWQTEWIKMATKTVVRTAVSSGKLPIMVHPGELTSVVYESEQEPEPVEQEVPKLEFQQCVDMARDCEDMTQCDKLERELTEQYPDQRQEIYDIIELRREQIARVEEQA